MSFLILDQKLTVTINKTNDNPVIGIVNEIGKNKRSRSKSITTPLY